MVPDGNRITPIASDTFVIQTLVGFTPGAMTIGAVQNETPPFGVNPSITFQDLASSGAPFAASTPSVLASASVTVWWYGCTFQALELGQDQTNFLMNNLLFSPGGPELSALWAEGDFDLWEGGGVIGAFIIIASSTYRWEFDVILQACQGGVTVLSGTRVIFATAGIFDTVAGGPGGQNPGGDGVRVVPGGNASCYADNDLVNTIWGAGNAGAGIGVASGASFQYDNYVASTPVMTITGANPGLNDFSLGQASTGTLTSYAPANTGTPAGPHTNSWANLANAADFSVGAAFQPLYNAWITPFNPS